jgi:hypothetical protein
LSDEVITRDEVWNVIDFMNALYSSAPLDKNNYFYDTINEYKTLVDLNNNEQIPDRDSLRQAIATYKNSAETLQDYSEFMETWDAIYKRAIEYKTNLLAFDIDRVPINIVDDDEFESEEYKEDCKRVDKFFNYFKAKQEFRNVVKNMLKTDTYFCWLRDSEKTFDDTPIDLNDNKESFSLQMMPQKYCKLTGRFTSGGANGFLWDFNLNYFNGSNVNVLNYDETLAQAYSKLGQSSKDNSKQMQNFIVDNMSNLGRQNTFNAENYIRTKVNAGSWLFKYDTSNFNTVPPLTSLLKSVFDDDIISKLQRDKDIISANAIILGEMKTRDKDNVGNNKNAFTIDPKVVGQLMRLARNGINKNIKQIALPLEETRLYQFADNNSNMYKNQLKTSAGLGASNSSLIYTDEKLSQEEAQLAANADYQEIANAVYPQFENFLNFFVNKKTKRYKFRFRVSGSTLPFKRKEDIDTHLKLSDKGIQVPLRKWGTLLGYEGSEFETMVKEAKHSDMQNTLFALFNANTNTYDVGAPQKDSSDLAEGGAVSREYQ